MGTYPTSPRAEFLLWCKAHVPVFVANAPDIGLTPELATAFSAAVDAATATELAQETARESARQATTDVNNAFSALHELTGNLVRLVRAFAETSTDPGAVYALAKIPGPSPATPAPPPAQPTDLRVELDASTGGLTIRWKASNPRGTSGTSYLVRRRLPGESGFSFIGSTGNKFFTDTTLVAGPDSVEYTVQGQRADSTGPVSAIMTVRFGLAPGGGPTATATTERARLAA